MKFSIFQSPESIIYGIDSVKVVGKQVKKFGKKAMVITGRNSSKKSGTLDKILKSLQENNLDYVVFDEVKSDPGLAIVRQGVKVAKKFNIDVIVAVGGGSVIDASKAIGIVITNGGNIVDYENKTPEKHIPPIVAVPTTAGTGSEVSKFSIITDENRKIKMMISSNFIIPKIAILDPKLTLTMPENVTAETGMDAFTHAIEAYISKASQPMSDIYALKAIEIISPNLVKAVLMGDNLEVREKMLVGQMYAGLAFNNSSTALVHSMSRPLGAYYGVPHGLANALLLPEVMKFNRMVCAEKFKIMADKMGENVLGQSIREASYKAIKSIRNIFLETGLPTRLRDIGVDNSNFNKMAEDAISSRTTKLNPRKPKIEQIVEIYKKIY